MKDVPLPIPFYISDTSGDDITSGAYAVATIRRLSDNKYFNSSTGLWQDVSYDISMSHYYKGIWTYSVTFTQNGSYLIKCDSDVYKVRDGFLVYITDKFDNLDTIPTISEGVDSIIGNVSGIPTIDSNIDLINSKLDENLDVAVSTRSTVTEESIWTYSNRTNTPSNADGVGVNTVTITVTKDSVIESGVNVFVYDNDRIAKFSAVTDSNGQVIFKVDDGIWYFEFKKSGLWEKEVQQTISSNISFTVDLEGIDSDDVINILFREFLIPTLEVGSTVKIGIEAYGSTSFSISSATATITGYENDINCTIDNKKIYALCPITVLGWNIIKFSVVVGNQIFGYEIRRYVD